MSLELQITLITYNRNVLAAETVARLIEQLSERAQLLILDNYSDVPVEDTLRPLVQTHKNRQWIRMLRHRSNIGADANVMRALELSGAPWTWLLCDDDLPDSGAIAKILELTEKNPDASFINCYSPHTEHPVRHAIKRYVGLREFVEGMDSFGAIMFAPTCVFRSEEARRHLSAGYRGIYCHASHVAVVLSIMAEGGVAVLSEQVVLRYRENYRPTNSWSLLSYAMTVPLLAEFILDPGVSRALRTRIRQSLHWPGILKFALLLEERCGWNGAGRRAYALAVSRAFVGARPELSWVVAKILGCSLRTPRVSMAVIDRIARVLRGTAIFR